MKPHLCQAGQGRSCAACCGLYNFKHRSKQETEARLLSHTKAVNRIGYQNPEALSQWGKQEIEKERADLLVPSLPTCPFTGFIGKEQIGCLLHPTVTGKKDLRDLGVYQSSEICESFTCPSFTWLTDDEFFAIFSASNDWYHYGLSVTDVEFLREILKHLTTRCGILIKSKKLLLEKTLPYWKTILSWKQDWPYRDPQKRFSSFAVSKTGEVSRASIDYSSLDMKVPSQFDRIFLCLESHFETKEHLLEAEKTIETVLQIISELIVSI